jgi:hypothetical protein
VYGCRITNGFGLGLQGCDQSYGLVIQRIRSDKGLGVPEIRFMLNAERLMLNAERLWYSAFCVARSAFRVLRSAFRVLRLSDVKIAL